MNATNTVPWESDPHYFQAGEAVEVHSFGRWYPGTVSKIGRTRVTVFYRTGSGAERTKAFPPFLVRPVRAVTFEPTHAIQTRNRQVKVMLVNGAAYTRAEWNAGARADYERQEDGTWTFQGQAFEGTVKAITQEASTKAKKAKNPKSTLEIIPEPIQMSFGFAIRAAMILGKWNMPEYPNAAELSVLTGKSPEVFPRKWTVKEAQYALDHANDLISVVAVEKGEVP